MPELTRKQLRVQRAISVAAISILSFVGLETLVKVANLYQLKIYVYSSLAIYALMLIWLYFIFDLHFKPDREPLAFALRYFKRRFKHFASWRHFRHFQNYLVLPGMLFWSSAIIIYINFRRESIQQFVAIVSSVCLIISYSLFKEIFHAKESPIRNSHFVLLTYVKIYAAWLVFCAAFGIVRYECFPPFYFYFLAVLGSMMLLYQALFQSARVNYKNVRMIALLSLAMGVVSFFVFKYWNVNYFSAGIFMAAVYNLLWFMAFHSINKNLTRHAVLEQVAIFALIAIMVFGSTNFKARIDWCGNAVLMPPADQ